MYARHLSSRLPFSANSLFTSELNAPWLNRREGETAARQAAVILTDGLQNQVYRFDAPLMISLPCL